MQRIDDDIKATVKKIIQGNEKRKRRMLNGNASAFDRMAYSVINEALNNSCHNIDSEAAREQMQKQIYKSVVHCTPYESTVTKSQMGFYVTEAGEYTVEADLESVMVTPKAFKVTNDNLMTTQNITLREGSNMGYIGNYIGSFIVQ